VDRPGAAIELKAIVGLSPEQQAQPERSWKEVVATPDAGKPGEYLADLGGRFPLERLALRLPQENTIVPSGFCPVASPRTGDPGDAHGCLIA